MALVPVWSIYSYWVFALVIVWLGGLLPFSPLSSAIVNLIAAVFFSATQYCCIKPVGLFLIASHIIPIFILRKTKMDILPNLLTFFVYNAFLFMNSTDVFKVYRTIYTDPPQTIQGHLYQRALASSP